MTEAGEKEIFYIRLLPADEMADYICSLPYTLVETIIETALKDEDGLLDLLTESAEILKKNMHLSISKKALRKLLKVCQVLGCVGYFDFGDWEIFRNGGNTVANAEPPIPINNSINDDLPILRNFVYLYYPQFKTDFETLKTTPKQKPFITEIEDYLQWAYSKKSLSEYFGYMPKPGKKEHKWRLIEKLFNVTSLKNSFSTNGNGPKKPSKGYELLLEVLKKYPQP